MLRKAVIIFIALSLLLSACFGNGGEFSDQDGEYANKQLNMLLDAMENEDKDLVKSLFSKNTVSNVQNFETSIENLFEYFKGTAPAWEGECPQVVDGEQEEGNKKIIISSSYDIKTSEKDYRICFKACRVDTANPDNVGLWSLYIILAEDDGDLKYAYWGDGKDTPGINIGVPNMEETK